MALLSEDRIIRRRQGVQGNAIPVRQSLEVDRGNYEVGRRNFVAWSIWTILHLPFTGTSKRPAAAVQVGDAIDGIRLVTDGQIRRLSDYCRRTLTLVARQGEWALYLGTGRAKESRRRRSAHRFADGCRVTPAKAHIEHRCERLNEHVFRTKQ